MSKTSQSQLLVDQRWLGNITSKRGNRWRGKYKLWTLLTFITALIVVSYLTIKQDCDQKPLTIPSMSYVPESDKRLGFCCGRLNERLGQRSGVIDTRSPLPSLPSNIKKLVSWLVIKPGDSQSQLKREIRWVSKHSQINARSHSLFLRSLVVSARLSRKLSKVNIKLSEFLSSTFINPNNESKDKMLMENNLSNFKKHVVKMSTFSSFMGSNRWIHLAEKPPNLGFPQSNLSSEGGFQTHIQNSNRSANVIPNERIETKTSSNFCFHVQNSSRSANMIPNEQIETKTSSNFCFLRIEPSNMEVDTPPSSPVKSVESSPSQDNSSQKIVDLTNSSPTKSSKNAQKLEESPENKKPNPQQNLLQRRC